MSEELQVIIRANIGDLQRKVNNAREDVEDFSEQSEKAMQEVDAAFEKTKDIVKTSMAAFGAALAAGAAALIGLAESTREYRNEQEKLTTAFEAAGSTAEVAYTTYDELNGVLGDSGQAVEAANHLAKLTNNEEELAQWTDTLTGIYATFGSSLPLESLTEAANESAKVGTVTGALADAINWAAKEGETFGVTLKKNTKKNKEWNEAVKAATTAEDFFNLALSECSTEQERQQLILKTLNGTYKDASARFKENNKDVIEANKAQERLNKSMANIGKTVEPLLTDLKNLGASLLEDCEEPIEDIVAFVRSEAIPAIQNSVKWVNENKGAVIGMGVAVTGAYTAWKIAAYSAKLAEDGLTIAIVAKTAAQKAANIAMAATPWGLAAAAAGLLIGAVVQYTSDTEKAIEVTDLLTEEELAFRDAATEASEALREQSAAYAESAAEIMSESSYMTKLAEELQTLVDANGRVQEADQARVNFILGKLKEAYGEEYSMVDGVIQNYDELQTSIQEVIASKTAAALIEANNENYINAIKSEGTAYADAARASAEYQDQLLVVEDLKAEIRQMENDLADDLTNLNNRQAKERRAEIDAKKAELDEEKLILDDKKKTNEIYADNYAEIIGIINDHTAAETAMYEKNYDLVADILTEKGEAIWNYADDVDQATIDATEALYKEAYDAGIAAQKTRKNFEDGVEGYTEEMVEESEAAYEEALGAWADAYNDANGIGTDLGGGLESGMASTVPNLVKKAKSMITSIWNAMRKEADSHSPSKKTISLGEDMGEGLPIGFARKEKKAKAGAAELVKESLEPLQNAAYSINSFEGIRTAAPLYKSQLTQPKAIISGNAPQAAAAATNTKQPIILQIGKKVLGEVVVESINDITKQTGNLPLVLA